MVHRTNVERGTGGHIGSYASAAAQYEVGFNHFFRGKDHPGGGDQVYFQGHSTPGVYARAFLEGRFDRGPARPLPRRGRPGGLSSYPHPRLMPDFWEFPTVSMGLGPLNAIYQARFNRYLGARGIKDTSDQRVWFFGGDGETAEPESLGALAVASREGLDNLTFVINCNLQQLDGPVRGNGKIIQELEGVFRGAGWNVIKVVWGRQWDDAARRGRRRRAGRADERGPRRPDADLHHQGRGLRPRALLRRRPAPARSWPSTSPTTTSPSSPAAGTTTASSTRRTGPRPRRRARRR